MFQSTIKPRSTQPEPQEINFESNFWNLCFEMESNLPIQPNDFQFGHNIVIIRLFFSFFLLSISLARMSPNAIFDIPLIAIVLYHRRGLFFALHVICLTQYVHCTLLIVYCITVCSLCTFNLYVVHSELWNDFIRMLFHFSAIWSISVSTKLNAHDVRST